MHFAFLVAPKIEGSTSLALLAGNERQFAPTRPNILAICARSQLSDDTTNWT